MTTSEPIEEAAAGAAKERGGAWSRGLSLTGGALKRRIRERFTEPAALRGAYRRAQPTPLYTLPQDETGSADRGRRLLSGVYKFSEVAVEAAPETVWTLEPPNRAWLAELQSFAWLADLAALGRPPAQKLATALAVGWLESAVRYDPIVWAPVISANRLRSWLVSSDILPLDAENGAKLTRSAVAHLDWLLRRGFDAPPGLPALTVGVAIVEAAVSLESASARYETAAARLDQILAASLLEDGGVVGRSPTDALLALDRLGLLLARCDEAGAPISASLRDAPARLGRAIRFHRVGDGGLPVFQSGWEASDGRVDAALARYRLPAEPARALPQSGYMKLVGGRVSVIMDAAPAPMGAAAERGHESALAIEMTSGRRRLVVNCGSAAHLDAEWSRFGRSAPAHSTATVDGAPFAKPAARTGPHGEEEIALVGPPTVTHERKEERNGVWALAAHDGYVADYGLTTTRRLFLSADGGDFRGEDSFRSEGALAKKTFEKRLSKLPRARRERGLPAEARFHLHPEISAALVAEGEAATLRLPHGEVWVMRQSGGELSLEDSVYLGRWGRPESTLAIVIRADVGPEGGRIRWAFRRVGELEQLPKDLNALLPPPGAPEDALFGAKGELNGDNRPRTPPKTPSPRK